MKKLITGIVLNVFVWTAGPAPAADPVCGDVNDNGTVTSTDALLVLKKGVGQPISLNCLAYDEQVATCLLDLSSTNADLSECKNAPECGNGLVEEGEQCDGDDFAAETCETQGFAGGTLGCASGCEFNTKGCYDERFDDSGDTVIDNETGLEWEKKNGDEDGGDKDASNPHDIDNPYQWSAMAPVPDGGAFHDFLGELNGASTGVCYAEHCDWRLPTPKEYATILTTAPDCTSGPCLVAKALYPMIEDGYYWTIATDEVDAKAAFYADLASGAVENSKEKGNEFYVRAVRTRR